MRSYSNAERQLLAAIMAHYMKVSHALLHTHVMTSAIYEQNRILTRGTTHDFGLARGAFFTTPSLLTSHVRLGIEN